MVDITLILMIKRGNLYRRDVHIAIKKDILISWMSFQVNPFVQCTKTRYI